MLLQTNSYLIPAEKRNEHERLMRRFRQMLKTLGCDHFEVCEQLGAEFGESRPISRFVQMLRFRDRRHFQAVQSAERNDPAAQALVKEFMQLLASAGREPTITTNYYDFLMAAPDPTRPATAASETTAM